MGVVSRRWVWVESMGMASGCGCKEVYRFPHITYPLFLLYLLFFAAASLLFVHFKRFLPIYLSIYSICLSLSLSVYLSVSLSVFLCHCLFFYDIYISMLDILIFVTIPNL